MSGGILRGEARLGGARMGRARRGLAWPGEAWLGTWARCKTAYLFLSGVDWIGPAWLGRTRHAAAGQSSAQCGSARHGLAGLGSEPGQVAKLPTYFAGLGEARQGAARPCGAGRGTARNPSGDAVISPQYFTRRGTAGRGTALRGRAWLGTEPWHVVKLPTYFYAARQGTAGPGRAEHGVAMYGHRQGMRLYPHYFHARGVAGLGLAGLGLAWCGGPLLGTAIWAHR